MTEEDARRRPSIPKIIQNLKKWEEEINEEDKQVQQTADSTSINISSCISTNVKTDPTSSEVVGC